MKISKIKTILSNILSISLIILFFLLGLILVLIGTNVIPANLKKPAQITCDVFGGIFLGLFTFVIIKIITILKSENRHKKNAIDLDLYLQDVVPSDEQKKQQLASLFKDAPKEDIESRNIYYSYLFRLFRKIYRRPNLEIKDLDLKHKIEKFIIDIKQAYGYFDVYLAIEFTQSINRKIILRGEYKHYKIYFDTIREIQSFTHDLVKKMLEFS
ncbi:hypothetical protein [Metamycoplasma hyosynoviae]|uniref:Uncharacterized protein n=1 Tax=Metamycoplasma hyosynoviae TaxID=29559 RepID=A0A063YL24_9BACT|nr:hypothetical protein [Metamycoplasma hyosynoviae]ASI53873.1 hypothetical protein MHSN_01515 [Metamycoplasma hyosynoviae]KDE41509.1 hypothetical protein NPL7_03555 [Metamycoplasma hyosynoviae]KDE42778.1 hypothetical protein NPL3_00675 [Metamycoplasma hyosynoviae]KDE43183.1 hypothetical protein NPL5_02910 [Metamycoplasma hyosynoviae]KDE44760.1 hypothetical protein NPL6_00865 [Metamycoplasma hyosynoviae]